MHFSYVKDVITNVNNFSFAFLLILKNLEEKDHKTTKTPQCWYKPKVSGLNTEFGNEN